MAWLDSCSVSVANTFLDPFGPSDMAGKAGVCKKKYVKIFMRLRGLVHSAKEFHIAQVADVLKASMVFKMAMSTQAKAFVPF